LWSGIVPISGKITEIAAVAIVFAWRSAMLSPFPGMDPYLETAALWSDVHARFITYLSDAINDYLPSDYEARIDEKVNLIEIAPPRRKLIEPDVAVTQRGLSRGPSPAPAGLATLEPVTLSLIIEEETHERYIEILHRPDRNLIAIIEVFSRTNKEEPGRSLYVAKRNALIPHPVHLVELDLLLKGQRLRLEQALPAADYYAFVSRWDRRPNCEVYHWTMQQPLPAIPIPLRPPDPDVWIDIAAVFRTTYQRGRYARSIDYAGPPPIALDAERLAWVTERARGGAVT
jgi:hypothetical protein